MTEGPNHVFAPVSGTLNALALARFCNVNIYCLLAYSFGYRCNFLFDYVVLVCAVYLCVNVFVPECPCIYAFYVCMFVCVLVLQHCVYACCRYYCKI